MTDTIDALGRIRLRAIALLGLVFLAGAVAGAAIFGAIGRQPFARPGAVDRRPFRPGQRGPESLPPELDRLGLSPEQRARVIAILEAARPKTDSLMLEFRPRLRALRDSVDAQIATVLTAAQREQFTRERRAGPPPNGGFPPGPNGGPGRGRPPFGPPPDRQPPP